MTRDQQISILAAALLLASVDPATAGTVVKTTSAPISVSSNSPSLAASTDFTFTDIANADELVSVSGGTAQGFEGGTFSVSVDYEGGGTQQIFSRGLTPPIYNLSNIANLPFTQGTINGLKFTITAFANSLIIPTGTQFTFHTVDAVPEPATWATFLLGFGAVGGAMRTRGRKKLVAA